MDLTLKSTNNDTSLLNLVYSAQLIADTFAKGLEDNNCLLISTVQLHQKINDTIKDVTDLTEPVYNTPEELVNKVTLPKADSLNPLVAGVIQSSKERCFNCKVSLPKLSFKGDLDFSLDDMKAHIQLYKDLFNFQKINPCQAIDMFKYQCIPDVLRLIALLLNAYLMITSLRRLAGLSLSVFIKGIISALLGKLIASVNISLNLGQLNLSCFIEYLNQILAAIPSTDNIVANFTSEQIIGLIEALPIEVQRNLIATYLDNTYLVPDDGPFYSKNTLSILASRIPKSDLTGLLELNGFNTSATDALNNLTPDLNKQVSDASTELNTIVTESTAKASNLIEKFNQRAFKRTVRDTNEEIKTAQQGLDSLFKDLSDTVNNAVGTFNGFIEQIQSLKAYFECELTRSSDDLLSLMTELNKVIKMLNLLSSVVYALAKKDVRKKCQKASVANKLSTGAKLTEDELLLKDFLQDFYQKQVEIVATEEENIEILVYERPIITGLPKISLLDCSIDSFIKDHTLDAVIERALKDVLAETEDKRKIVDEQPWESYVFPNLTGGTVFQEELKTLTDILYSKPDIPTTSFDTKQSFNIKPNYQENKNNILNNTVKCTSIADVLNILDNLEGL